MISSIGAFGLGAVAALVRLRDREVHPRRPESHGAGLGQPGRPRVDRAVAGAASHVRRAAGHQMSDRARQAAGAAHAAATATTLRAPRRCGATRGCSPGSPCSSTSATWRGCSCAPAAAELHERLARSPSRSEGRRPRRGDVRVRLRAGAALRRVLRRSRASAARRPTAAVDRRRGARIRAARCASSSWRRSRAARRSRSSPRSATWKCIRASSTRRTSARAI